MTNANLPDRWLVDRRFLKLSDPAYRLFHVALVWSVSNRTDGYLPADDLELMPGVPRLIDAAGELVRSGLWELAADGSDAWTVPDFAVTQTSAAKLASAEQARIHEREAAAERKRRQRHRERADQAHGSAPSESRRDSHGRDSQDRPGQDRPGEEELRAPRASALPATASAPLPPSPRGALEVQYAPDDPWISPAQRR